MAEKAPDEIRKENLVADLQLNTSHLTGELAEFPEEKFDKQPGQGQWSAAMIAEHLLVVEHLVNKVLEGNVKPVDRDPGEKIGMIEGAFRDYEKKYPAGDAILPRKKINDRDRLIREIGKNRKHLQKILLKEDLGLLCTDYKHFGFGYLTRMEWACFNILHTERHLHQMRKLI